MAKIRTKYICQQCGGEQSKWVGRCPDCAAWNTMEETVDIPQSPAQQRRQTLLGTTSIAQGTQVPLVLPQIKPLVQQRISVGYAEMDRVLGGGLVAGSLTLIGGEPGIGKSTLLLQVSGAIAKNVGPVLYVSGEESIEQVKMRAERLDITGEQLYLLASIELDVIAEAISHLKPALVVVDSIQTVLSNHLTAAPGSISQVRECTLQLMHLAKSTHTPIFIIGHVTKEGTVAGPKALEHIADAVLYLEGERYHTYRLLRGVKNRFGATHEVGVFEMHGEGLVEVANPSAVFLADRAIGATGSAVVVSMEGTRPLLVEVQALVTPSNFGNARCTTNGIEHNRLLMLLAVLTKRVGLAVGNHDVYANVVGGFTLEEPAVDLGVAAAIASSYREKHIPPDIALIGEIGLSGELRPVSRLALRVREAAKLGFKRCIVPSAGKGAQVTRELEHSALPGDFRVITSSTLAVALEIALH
ncbi:MAG TPA: DNA repair protein RadA [Ktedonobacter sp.]|jgi:DNA repair protein RadA/Sms|nr:DNA repair protein RadA [Ktedonobacter sp.]HAT46170.1 DNA repair protein RadA [Ktedonobacter sp.]HCF87008.1 DNA repair protein RadA [Ktedonobacter sp.]HCJ32788.1 DNA repair protein RadA [Ktedonobacter sp.]